MSYTSQEWCRDSITACARVMFNNKTRLRLYRTLQRAVVKISFKCYALPDSIDPSVPQGPESNPGYLSIRDTAV